MSFALILLSLLASPTQARVFDFNNESVASYIHGTFGLSILGQDPYGNSSGSGTTFSDKYKYDLSGEFGVLFLVSKQFGVRFGVEIFEGYPGISGASGVNSAGQQRMSVKSSVYGVNPQAVIEYYYRNRPQFRLFHYFGAGYALISMDNNYTLTTQGSSDLSGLQSYDEQSKALTFSGLIGTGGEVHFTDTATFVFDINYRYLPVSDLKYKNSATGAQGAFQSGSPVLNDDGSKRHIDLSGFSVGIGFRFYIKTL